ncbi:hypothetical protein ACIBL5_32780 [Streptomyces sp. NPDC050516]|uniref:hypothetical protein n=1 Tax=Streptomyces sp. NPDC050516 TaxID=3365621 RepID=UPI00378EE8EB
MSDLTDLTGQNTAEAPPQPTEPPLAEVPPTPPAPPKDRRVLRAALRWTAAVAVFGVLGTGIAYGITAQERTDVPGLSTKSDGRWAYPKLVKPALPAGAALPYAADNPGMIHYADLEQLLLPAPAGSTPDPTLKGDKSRITTDRFLQEFAGDNRVPNMRQDLAQGGLRQIAARGWTMPDGTATRIYLVRFHTSGYQNAFTTLYFSNTGSAPRVLKDIEGESALDDGYLSGNGIPHVRHDVYVESAPTGPVQVRHAYIAAGDIVALVVQSRKGTAAAVPFHQTTVLQEQLLG